MRCLYGLIVGKGMMVSWDDSVVLGGIRLQWRWLKVVGGLKWWERGEDGG